MVHFWHAEVNPSYFRYWDCSLIPRLSPKASESVTTMGGRREVCVCVCVWGGGGIKPWTSSTWNLVALIRLQNETTRTCDYFVGIILHCHTNAQIVDSEMNVFTVVCLQDQLVYSLWDQWFAR